MKSDASPPVLLGHSWFLNHDPKQVRKMRPYPPLATALVAALVRASGREVALFDAMLSRSEDEFAMEVQRASPRVVGILEDNFNFLTKMCTQRNRDACARMIADARRSGAKVAVNGSHATDDPGFYLDAGADAVILGETERTFLELVEIWERDPDADLRSVPGLAIPARAVGAAAAAPHRTPPRPFVEDLDLLPMPAWDLVDAERYRAAWTSAHGRLSWNIVTTRGCPYRCNWCAKPVYGTRYAQRSPASVAKEMRFLKDTVRPDHLWFADDIFGLSNRWIERFGNEVADRDAKTPFTIQSRVDLMTPSGVAALRSAGAEEVWLGVESGSQSILDAMDKGTNLRQIRDATSLLKEHGIRASWFLQLGYPGEEWGEILSTRDLLREARPDDIGVSVSYPLPGTVFHERVKSQLGLQTLWEDSDDLAMMFEGPFPKEVYRYVRDLLHEEATATAAPPSVAATARRLQLDAKWAKAGIEAEASRNAGSVARNCHAA